MANKKLFFGSLVIVQVLILAGCLDLNGGGDNKTLSSISVKTGPSKTIYEVNEGLNLTGLVLTATYSDGSTADISDINKFSAAGFSSVVAGSRTVTVSYTEGDITKMAVFTVTIKPKGNDPNPDPYPGPDPDPNSDPDPDPDPNPDPVVQDFTINSTESWEAAINAIKNGGNDKEYTLTIGADFELHGSNSNTFGSASGITVTITGDHIISLAVATQGYLLYITSGQTVVIHDLDIKGHNNNSDSLVYVSNGTFIMQGNASVFENTAIGNYRYGGGVYVNNGTFIMQDDSSVSSNKAGGGSCPEGSGVALRYSNFTMQDNASVSNNTSDSDWYVTGIGVSVFKSTFKMQDNASVSGNYGGNGVWIGFNSTFTMQDSTKVSDNDSFNGSVIGGAGVQISSDSSFIMKGNSSVSGTTDGGGVYVEGGSSFIMQDSSTVSDNTASYRHGGGVFVGENSTFTIQDRASVSFNTATSYNTSSQDIGNGGGVYISGGTFIMKDSASIFGNTAIRGGGVCLRNYVRDSYNRYPVSFTKSGGVIYGNSAGDNSNTASNGYAVYWDRSKNVDRVWTTYPPLVRNTTLGLSDNISTDDPNTGWE